MTFLPFLLILNSQSCQFFAWLLRPCTCALCACSMLADLNSHRQKYTLKMKNLRHYYVRIKNNIILHDIVVALTTAWEYCMFGKLSCFLLCCLFFFTAVTLPRGVVQAREGNYVSIELHIWPLLVIGLSQTLHDCTFYVA